MKGIGVFFIALGLYVCLRAIVEHQHRVALRIEVLASCVFGGFLGTIGVLAFTNTWPRWWGFLILGGWLALYGLAKAIARVERKDEDALQERVRLMLEREEQEKERNVASKHGAQTARLTRRMARAHRRQGEHGR